MCAKCAPNVRQTSFLLFRSLLRTYMYCLFFCFVKLFLLFFFLVAKISFYSFPFFPFFEGFGEGFCGEGLKESGKIEKSRKVCLGEDFSSCRSCFEIFLQVGVRPWTAPEEMRGARLHQSYDWRCFCKFAFRRREKDTYLPEKPRKIFAYFSLPQKIFAYFSLPQKIFPYFSLPEKSAHAFHWFVLSLLSDVL